MPFRNIACVVDDDNLLYPLTKVCGTSERALPDYEPIPGDDMPEPYRSLLVHKGDMTSKLEEFYQCTLHLRVLCENVTEASYFREVVLIGGDLPLEYGAIDINLAAFDDQVRNRILEGKQPLGGLLNEFDIEYASRPRAFIKLQPDDTVASALGLTSREPLYGRCNELLGLADATLARIVEILRPAQPLQA